MLEHERLVLLLRVFGVKKDCGAAHLSDFRELLCLRIKQVDGIIQPVVVGGYHRKPCSHPTMTEQRKRKTDIETEPETERQRGKLVSWSL